MDEEKVQTNGNIFRAAGLVAVNVPMGQAEGERFDKQGWWHRLLQDREIWVAGTCSRVLLVTTQAHWTELAEQFSDFTARCMTQRAADKEEEIGNPNPFAQSKPCFLKKEGWEAYIYLLETVCGLHSPQVGEEHIAHQILDESYQAHKLSKHANRATWFDPIVSELNHDFRQVRKVIGPYIPPTLEDTARELADCKKDDDVLIITDNWKHTHDMLYALTRPAAKCKPKAIEIAHIASQEEAVTALQKQYDAMREHHPYMPEVMVSTLDTILAAGTDWLKSYKTIFITSELNCHPRQEGEIIRLWQQCGPDRPKLISLRMDRDYDGEIMPHAELKEEAGAIVILPDVIQEDYNAKLAYQRDLLERGKKACALCAQLREESKGKHRPRGDSLALGYDDYIAHHPIHAVHTRARDTRKGKAQDGVTAARNALWTFDRAGQALVSNLSVGMVKFSDIADLLESETGKVVRLLEEANDASEIGLSHDDNGHLVISGDIIAAATALDIRFQGKDDLGVETAR